MAIDPAPGPTELRVQVRWRAVWFVVLCLYAAGATADMAAHLMADVRAGQSWHDPANLAVACSAGLFWPADLIASLLL